MMDDNDDGARIGVWVALGVVALLLFGLIAGLAMRAIQDKPVAEAPVVAVPAAGADALVDVALSGEIVATVFFSLDQSDLGPDATAALGPALQALAASPGKKLVIAGFHDPSGDPAHNAGLARQRAVAVRAMLVAMGCDVSQVQLRRPEQTALGGPPEEARRVEVHLAD